MTHTPAVLVLSDAALMHFLSLLPDERISRAADKVTVHATCGDAVWWLRNGRWITAAPGFDTARRFGAPERPH